MAGFTLIDLAKPFLAALPEVELPYERLQFDDKLTYTIATGLVYLFAQLPLAAIPQYAEGEQSHVKDPIFFLRGVFAAEPKTLLEFGIFPIVSTPLILQLLAGLKLIKVNFKLQRDRELFQSLTKILALLQYFILTNIFIFAGYYGDNLSIVQILLLNIQLVGTGLMTILLSEVIDKGFGFVSGATAINTVSIATDLVADTIGLQQIKVDADGATEPQGAVINLFARLRSSNNTLIGGIVSAFNRDYLPNLTTTFLVLGVGAAVCYLQNCTIELPIRSTKARGMNNVYPIRLLYVGSLSVLFSYVVLFYIHITAFVLIQIVAMNDPSNIICKILGHYKSYNNLLYVPTFPLSLLTPPRSFISGICTQPLTFVVFTVFMVFTGVKFAYTWQAISGSSGPDVALNFKEQGITLTGRREQNIGKELNKVIPVASTTGAMILALIAVVGELLGLKGKGAAIVVGVSGGFSLMELVLLEYQQSGGQSMLAQAFGAASGF